ncbi:MAG: STAS domain-containing protein [Chloroherpetonaceae bacterium]|nr:STAS domain-containing protein [Chloroherpetonaceae bacterium]
MLFSKKQIGEILVLEFQTDVLSGTDAQEFHQALRLLLTEGSKQFVVDLAKVSYMNSSGLGAMTSALTFVKNSGGNLKLCQASERIKSLFVVTKLDRIFEIYETQDEAVASY